MGVYPPREAAAVVEERIFDGFPIKADESRIADFHSLDWRQRASFVETFEDDRLRELGRRLVFLEAPEAFNPQLRQQLGRWLNYRRNGREGVEAGRTIADALAEVEKLCAERPDKSAELEEIRIWLTR